MNVRKSFVGIGMLCLFTVAANAEWERTISAWDSRLPAEKKLQLSFWGGYWAWEDSGAKGHSIDGRLYLDYGLMDNWSLAVSPGYSYWHMDGAGSENGIGDTSLMSTYRFLDEAKAGFDLAAWGEAWFPTGNDNRSLGTGHVEPGIGLIASKTLGPIIAVANLGGNVIINADNGENDVIGEATLEGIYPLYEKLSLNAQFSAATKRWNDEDALIDLGLGARFKPQEQVFLAGAAYKCLTDNYDYGFQLAGGYEF